MFQAFAKNYAESITLVYYCFTGLIAFAAFAIGNVYLWKRDQKNQKERSKEEREYQERRQEYDRECHERRRKEDREHIVKTDVTKKNQETIGGGNGASSRIESTPITAN